MKIKLMNLKKSKLDEINNKIEFNKRSPKGEELLNSIKNEKLKNVIKELYRIGTTTGDGGTADAIRYEIRTGKLIGGNSHIR